LALLLAPALQAADARGGFRATGQAGPPVNRAVEPPRALADKSVDRIVKDIEKKHSAKVVSKDEREERGRKVLVLRLLSDEGGRVWNIKVDAETGKEIK
jgi:hypothetical protein